jgi:threonine efflux protein
MDALATLLAVFAVFIPALILPGPDFVAVVRAALARGTRDGLLTSLGVAMGLGFYATLSLVGLSALLVQHAWLAWAIRILGGAYLLWLGVKLLRTPKAQLLAEEATAPVRGSPLAIGVLVTLTNPKAVVLFASVFATAVTAATPAWLMGLMVALVFLAALGWYAAVTLFISSPPVARRFQAARHRIERAAGACFVLLGGRILLDARNPVTP